MGGFQASFAFYYIETQNGLEMQALEAADPELRLSPSPCVFKWKEAGRI